MKKHIITLSGVPGSGKSSTANKVASVLGFKRFSSGDFLREIAAERGMTIAQLMVSAEKQREIDIQIDNKLKDMGEHDDNLIIDSRLAFHWMPQAFKVFLKLDTHTAAERIFTHIQEEGRVSQHAQSIEDVQHDIEIRDTSDRKRYQALYNVDYSDERHFDLVIDTGITDLETSAQLIVEKYHEWLTR